MASGEPGEIFRVFPLIPWSETERKLKEMTNEEFADALANLADHYRISSDTPQVSVSIYAGSKEELVKLLKDFGGKWKKEGDWGRTTTTSDCYVRLVSESFGVTITVLRDRVCTRTITWECTPLLSDEDMAEVEEALTNVPSPADSVPSDSVPY